MCEPHDRWFVSLTEEPVFLLSLAEYNNKMTIFYSSWVTIQSISSKREWVETKEERWENCNRIDYNM